MQIVSVYACITLCVIKKLDVTVVGLCGIVFPEGFAMHTYCAVVCVFDKIK